MHGRDEPGHDADQSLHTSTTLPKAPLKSVKSQTITVEFPAPCLAPLGVTIVRVGVEFMGLKVGMAGWLMEVVLDVSPAPV